MMEQLLAAVDAVWPAERGSTDAAALRRIVARQMIGGSEHIDPQRVRRSADGDLRISLARAGVLVSKHLQSSQASGQPPAPKPSLRELFQGDPFFALEPAPDDPNRLYCVLHASRLPRPPPAGRPSNGGAGDASRVADAQALMAGGGGRGDGDEEGSCEGAGVAAAALVRADGGSSAFEPGDEEDRQLVAACDTVWPRSREDPACILKNELAHQMICGSQDLSPNPHLHRSRKSITVSLAQAGTTLERFMRRRPSLFDEGRLGIFKLRELLDADFRFLVSSDAPGTNACRCTLRLAALQSAASAAAALPGGPAAPPRPGAPQPPRPRAAGRAAPALVPARRGGGGGPGGDGGADPECPHPNNVYVNTLGLIRPTNWLKAQRGSGLHHASIILKACARCGFRGHASPQCRVPRCGRCRRFGHEPVDCAAACAACGVGGRARGDEGGRHHARECPFNRCRGCGRVGHYTAECPGNAPAEAPAAAAVAAAAANPAVGDVVPSTDQITQVQITAQIETLMDRLFEKAPEIAIELLGSEGVARLTEALSCGDPRAFDEIAAAADADASRGSGGGAVLTTIDRLRRGAAAGGPAPVVPPPVPQWGAAVRAIAGAAAPAGSGSGSASAGGPRPSPATAAQPQPSPLTRMHPAAGGSEGPRALPPASPSPPPPDDLVSLCDAVWPPSSGPHGLLKGALAKMLLAHAGPASDGGGGWDGRVCWMPLALAGPRLLAFWRGEQRLFAASPDGAPPFSSLAVMITGDPYLSCRARTAAAGGGGGGDGAAGPKGGELCVVLDSARLAQWGSAAPLPSFAGLMLLIDEAWDIWGGGGEPPNQGGSGGGDAARLAPMLLNWAAKMMAAEGNPGASTWQPSAALRVSSNDAAYSLLGSRCGDLLRELWQACPATAPHPFPKGLTAAALLDGQPLFTLWVDPTNPLVKRYGLDLYRLVGCARPAG